MDKKELLELVMSYKKSLAVMVTYEMGIFDLLHGKTLDIRMLSQQAGVNENYLYLLLLYLKSLNLTEEQKGKWSLNSGLESSFTQFKSLDSIIHHEKSIYQRWMYPNRLEQTLRAKDGERHFDQSGFSEREKELYDKTMYGSSLKILSLRLMRELREVKNPLVLEYGRSKNYILQALKKTGYLFEGYCMSDLSLSVTDKDIGSANVEKNRHNENYSKFDVIILYNTIHYYDERTWNCKLKLLQDMLKDDGQILIVDLFYQEEDTFSSEILLDWVTHGGINFITKESVKEGLKKSGLKQVKSIHVSDINSTILVIRKKRW